MAAKEISVKKYVVRLNGEEREQLEALIRKGKSAAQRLLKARIAVAKTMQTADTPSENLSALSYTRYLLDFEPVRAESEAILSLQLFGHGPKVPFQASIIRTSLVPILGVSG